MSGLDWTEELKKRTGIDFLTTRPMEIEKKSFEIIKGELGEEFVSRYLADALCDIPDRTRRNAGEKKEELRIT